MGTKEANDEDSNSMEMWCICRVVKPRSNHSETKDGAKETTGDTNSTTNGSCHVNGYASDTTPTPTEDVNPLLDADGTPAQASTCVTQTETAKMDQSPTRRRSHRERTDSTESSQSRMSESSRISFDPRDFDASFSSFRSSDTMEQNDLADQLSLVQQMVVEMKQGFSTAMEELSKIQYGDQNLQSQLADNKRECSEEIGEVRRAVEDLKREVEKLCGQLRSVTEVQQDLKVKIDGYQLDRHVLIEELEKSGSVSDQFRLRMLGSDDRDHHDNNKTSSSNNNPMSEVAPMMHPYLDSLQNHRGTEDHYNSDSSLTAAVSRSLSLTQALGEKCLQLDFSTTSSDDEDNSRHSQTQNISRRKSGTRQGSFSYEDNSNRHGQKIPPHEKVMEEVHREESARDIVEAEREYCSQIWILVDTYMNSLKQEEIISQRELYTLFPAYISQMYEQHCIMLRKLEDRMSKWKFNGVIGDVFAKLTDSQEGDGLSLYKDYINDFPTIINGINRWFAQSARFREIMQSPCLATAPILPLLLAPLQQVPKYSLLLKNIIKYTPVDHPDRYYLESSLSKLKLFLNMMNDDLEHAMQVLNISREPINRSRDSGNSQRSRSSGSSGEVNHRSSTRDSGIHSNSEERAKSPMSPNTTRRMVLQVLREKREQDAEFYEQEESHPATPRGRNQLRFGSHPDLSGHLKGLPEGNRASTHLSSLPQSKMFSSLSKLPLPQEKGKKVRIKKRQEGQHPGINPNYLRPLTPQILSTHFEGQGQRREKVDRQRVRPQSAMEFTSDPMIRHDRWIDMMSYNSTSPRHSSGSERSRKELHMSLQKLLAETNADVQEDSDNDQADNHVTSYHNQYVSARENIQRHGSGREQGSRVSNSYSFSPRRGQGRITPNPTTAEDYGIYGDDDEEEEEVEEEQYEPQEEIKPMKILQESHRPKIMVPRWRQNASPQPPSYSASVDVVPRNNQDFTSEENLAVSLAQSLLEGGKKQPGKTRTLPNPHKMKSSVSDDALKRRSLPPKEQHSESTERLATRPVTLGVRDKGNSKQRPGQSAPRPVESPRKNNSGSSPQYDLKVKRGSTDKERETSHGQGESVKDQGVVKNGVSTAMLTDVIAYTADCLEKRDNSIHVSSGSDSDTSQDVSASSSFDTKQNTASVVQSSVTQESTMSSKEHVSKSATSAEQKEGASTASSQLQSQFSRHPQPQQASSPSSPSDKEKENLTYYFQNRNQLNSAGVSNGSMFPRGPLTSSPVSQDSGNEDTSDVSAEKGNKTGAGEKTSHSKDRDSQEEFTPFHAGVSNGTMIDKDSSVGKVSQQSAQSIAVNQGATSSRAVDRLKQSFERKSQSVTFGEAENQPRSPDKNADNKRHSVPYGAHKQPLILKSFAMPQNGEDQTSSQTTNTSNSTSNSPHGGTNNSEQTHRMYRKAASLKTAGKYLGEASARQISKLERSTSPPVYSTPKDADKPRPLTSPKPLTSPQQTTAPHQPTPVKPMRRGNSPQRAANDGSLIPQRSLSPPRSLARDRPLSPQGPLVGRHPESSNTNDDTGALKSNIKDTKIPVLKKSPQSGSATFISKSTDDISKIKKKSALNSLKHIFGRKKHSSFGSQELSTPTYRAEEIQNV